jgi:hypothetical protein
MTEQNTIIPPEELVQRWAREIYDQTSCGYERDEYIARAAAQWGADQELEACCEWLNYEDRGSWGCKLRAARRPKPPSLKEQALEIIERGEDDWQPLPEDWATLRRALEALPDNTAPGD